MTINTSYTWVPRWTEDGANTTTGIGNAYVDEVSLLKNHGPYFSQRKHRLTASGVWELPWYRNERSIKGYVLGGWSIAPMLVYQSGQPWDMPGNLELAPGVNLADVALPGEKEGQFMYGVKPCVGQRQANGTYNLLSLSQAYGCTEPYFLIREAFQRRTTMFRYDEFPPAVVLAGGRELREDHPDHRHRAVSAASRGVQPLQQPDVRRAQLQHRHQLG